MRGVSAGKGFYPVKPRYLLFRTLNNCLKKPHKTYIGDVRCDAGRVLDYTSYFVTVGLFNTRVQLRLLGNYTVMLELLESFLCCLARPIQTHLVRLFQAPYLCPLGDGAT